MRKGRRERAQKGRGRKGVDEERDGMDGKEEKWLWNYTRYSLIK